MPKKIKTVGFSTRKQKILLGFLNVDESESVFVWGASSIPEKHLQKHVIRVEDGFLRSVGLGADLTRPISWVFDDLGIYFDATRPSRLEALLENRQFDSETLERASTLIIKIVTLGLSKYNTGDKTWCRPATETHRKVILIPGQVETDASIALGSLEIKTNRALARIVRANNPNAWIVYKPHPDVVAGLRQPGSGENQVGLYCDEITQDTDTHLLLEQVDEVHTITSLTGFEALLRGKEVFCYGVPFYAGWGLTEDVVRCERRNKRLTLPELVAGALLKYPRYCSLLGKGVISAEAAVDELITIKQQSLSKPQLLAGQLKRQGLKIYSRIFNP